MGTYPLRKSGLVQLAGRYRQHGQCRIRLCRFEAVTIKAKKQAHSEKRSAFISVNEGVVFGQTQAIRSCETGSVWFAIKRQIQRARKGRIKQTFITQAAGTAMFRQTFIVQQQQDLAVNPFPVAHLAS